MKLNNIKLLSGVAILGLVALTGGIYYTTSLQPKDATVSYKQPTETAETTQKDAYAAIDEADVTVLESAADIYWDASDPYYLYNKASDVALVEINTIDGGRSYNPILQSRTFPQTYGSMTILQSYKGDLKEKETVRYARLGATVTVDEYLKSMNKEQQEKFNRNANKITDNKKFVKAKMHDDIDIKVKKKYVVFLVKQTSEKTGETEYFITGLEHGLREVRGDKNSLELKDNHSQKWEKLNKVVKQK